MCFVFYSWALYSTPIYSFAKNFKDYLKKNLLANIFLNPVEFTGSGSVHFYLDASMNICVCQLAVHKAELPDFY